MRIGFDAKRAFYNLSGLGNYSRDTIGILMDHFPEEEYFLYTPGVKNTAGFLHAKKYSIRRPGNLLASSLPALWRTLLSRQIARDKIDLYHGLSHELPAGITTKKVHTVVTIHDLIFLRYPKFYSFTDRLIYLAKFRHSCNVANRIIAISEQTKGDLIQFLRIPENKIEVVYQGCNPRFYKKAEDAEKERIRQKYGLPSGYILCVATLENRKNQLVILQALLQSEIDMPVVFAGKEKEYAMQLRAYVSANKMKNVFFAGQVPAEDLPGIYQNAAVFVYPSLFEGFGIPILEALNSGVPVITSKDGCFPEAGGPGSIYVDVTNPDELGDVLLKLNSDSGKRIRMIEAGHQHVLKFREGEIAQNLMNVYQSVLKT